MKLSAPTDRKRHPETTETTVTQVISGQLAGGKPTGTGTFFEPTVLVDVDQSMSCMTEETFGPTLPVVKVADETEAIRLANDSVYGLSATVWTRDKERGERIARRLDVGAVNINDMMSNGFAFDIPMGGWKHSGVGTRLGGPAGVLKYCRPQAITSPRIPTQAKELLWYPASRRRTKVAASVLRASAARGVRRLGIKPRGA
jgi:acyl-CoA reductase-like NAD-dependent aldehyde dehydrogenase